MIHNLHAWSVPVIFQFKNMVFLRSGCGQCHLERVTFANKIYCPLKGYIFIEVERPSLT